MSTILISILSAAALIFIWLKLSRFLQELPVRRAGKAGEKAFFTVLKSVLTKDDRMFTNVEISWEGRRTELDAVVVNACGVFLFEVKNYSGELIGGENDEEWLKRHTSSSGKVYEKMVRNPIRQLKREIHLTASALRERGLDVWVSGCVYLTENNSPVSSPCIISSRRELERLIHIPGRRPLSKATIDGVCRFMK